MHGTGKLFSIVTHNSIFPVFSDSSVSFAIAYSPTRKRKTKAFTWKPSSIDKIFPASCPSVYEGEQRAAEQNDENHPFLFLLVNDSDEIQSNRLNFLKTINSSSRISFNKKALFRTQAIRFLSLTGNIYYFAYGAFPTSIELNMTRLPMNKWPSGPVFLRSHIPRSPGQESELTFRRNN